MDAYSHFETKSRVRPWMRFTATGCWAFCLLLWLAGCPGRNVPRPAGEEVSPREPVQQKEVAQERSEPRQEIVVDAGERRVELVPERRPEKVVAQERAPEAWEFKILERRDAKDIRVMVYNIEKNSVFVTDSLMQQRFIRLIKAVNADVYALQEVTERISVIAALFNKWMPLQGERGWHVRYAGKNVTISRYPIVTHHYQTTPTTGRKVSLALIDLPDKDYPKDLYLLNNHFTCCGGLLNDVKRQKEADQIVNWMRIARNPGGAVTLDKGTPMVLVGDFNLVGSLQPLRTMLSGDVAHEEIFGKDSPPDWDKTDLVDAKPLHNGVGPDDYTWRWDGAGFPSSRIDLVLYTDSVLSVAHKLVLNTTLLSGEALRRLGLEALDVAKGRNQQGGLVFDHLPLIVDFRLK